jgi:hypothetical protein
LTGTFSFTGKPRTIIPIPGWTFMGTDAPDLYINPITNNALPNATTSQQREIRPVQPIRADFSKNFAHWYRPLKIIRPNAKAMTTLSLKVRLKIGDVEVEIQGTQKEVAEAFNNIDSYTEKFRKTFSPSTSQATRPRPISDEEFLQPTEEVPRIVNPKSKAEAVKQLLVSGWAHSPRTIKEIVDALQISGIFVQSTDISGILTNLVRKGEASRVKTNRGWGYYVAFAKVGRGVRVMGPTVEPEDSDKE